MPEGVDNEFLLERINGRSIVSLKVARRAVDSARERLQLAAPLTVSSGDPQSLWLGPDRWLLVSDTKRAGEIVEDCGRALAGVTHHAVDNSAGLAVFRIRGRQAAAVLASGTGVDLRPDRFSIGQCCRARLAEIAAVLVAEDTDRYAVYIDRSYATYLEQWLSASAGVYQSYRGTRLTSRHV